MSILTLRPFQSLGQWIMGSRTGSESDCEVMYDRTLL